jgi:hypothetical protein
VLFGITFAEAQNINGTVKNIFKLLKNKLDSEGKQGHVREFMTEITRHVTSKEKEMKF